MALIPATLAQELSKILNPNDPLFKGYPADTTQAIANFAIAINGYAGLVTPPSVGQALGITAFNTTMAPIAVKPITPTSPTFQQLFPSALLAYATQLGIGMAPAFTGTPPVIPIVLESVWELGLTPGTTHQQVIQLLSTTIDAWFRTGLAVNNASGATVTWL